MSGRQILVVLCPWCEWQSWDGLDAWVEHVGKEHAVVMTDVGPERETLVFLPRSRPAGPEPERNLLAKLLGKP